MLKILVVAQFVPMPDRQAGMLRLLRLLEILSDRYELHFYADQFGDQVTEVGLRAMAGYESSLHSLGIQTYYGGWNALNNALHRHNFDILLFEHHYFARLYLDEVRHVRPHTKIVIDTIDIQYASMLSRARASRRSADLRKARRMRRVELRAYRDCDVLIAISDQEKAILLREDASLNVEVIPLILDLPAPGPARNNASCNLIFVGNFVHMPNVDAVLFFCAMIFPLIKREIPHAKVQIVGNAPTEAVRKLASNDIEVTGYVADIRAFYESNDISIAPLTWGGGLKNKIAEAMSHGLPVVSTTVGIDGFGLTPGDNVVVADTPEEFSSGVIKLHQDRDYYEQIRTNGRRFVEESFVGQSIKDRIYAVFDKIERSVVKKLPLRKRLKHEIPDALERHLLWRFNRDRG